jgi:hypothetical protein
VGTLSGVAQNVLTVNASGLVGVSPTVTVTQVAMGGVFAFTDSDLDLLYDQAQTNFYRAIQYAYMALASDMARLNDYVAGQSQEKRSQVYDHVKEQVDYYAQWANADRQVQSVHLEHVPPQPIAVPVSSGTPATAIQYSDGRPFGRWWRMGR